MAKPFRFVNCRPCSTGSRIGIRHKRRRQAEWNIGRRRRTSRVSQECHHHGRPRWGRCQNPTGGQQGSNMTPVLMKKLIRCRCIVPTAIHTTVRSSLIADGDGVDAHDDCTHRMMHRSVPRGPCLIDAFLVFSSPQASSTSRFSTSTRSPAAGSCVLLDQLGFLAGASRQC